MMMITPKVREMIFEGRSSTDIRTLAIEQGMTTLYMDGIQKAMAGTTTLEEVFRVCKRTEQDKIVEIEAA
jgi:type IV pilus assembly protein PilB